MAEKVNIVRAIVEFLAVQVQSVFTLFALVAKIKSAQAGGNTIFLPS